MYLKASTSLKIAYIFGKKLGDEAVDHKMDLLNGIIEGPQKEP